MTPLALPAADSDPADVRVWVEQRATQSLDRVDQLAHRLRSEPPAAPIAVLRAWDEITRLLGDVSALGSLYANVHPAEQVREAAEQAETEADKLATRIQQDRALYDVLAGLDRDTLEQQDPTSARLLDKTLLDFRRSGVDRDDATRARIAEISERLTAIDQEFGRNIRNDVRTVKVQSERLAGMPQDWIDAHRAGDDGLVAITTDYPDSVPARTFIHDAGVRRQVTEAFLDRGWPDNDPLLQELFALRHELATLVGYDDWASYDADVKMIDSGPAIPGFIDRIAEAAGEPMRRDLDVLVDRMRRDVPDADGISPADAPYYTELVKRERYDVDSQQVRTYLHFDKVRRGLLEVTGRLFGLGYTPVPDAPVWHQDVTVYDVHRTGSGEHLGRIYLDLHPREGKYKHAAQFTLANGVAGVQLPEGVLVCNFSRGLMEHDHVVTLFHEFGHLIHHVLGGHQRWARFSGVATEWDFVEAPSQMLEEWAWHADVLATFATDEAGGPIPADLVERMRAAEDFGKGIYARQQMFYAAVAYYFHADRPADLTARLLELQERYSPYLPMPGTHFHAGFGHLGGYSSAYYTYMWSLVIAKDLFSAFDEADPFDPEVARRYADTVLARGGSADAADLVAEFLGRSYTFDAYAAWLSR